jgi:cytochrome c peroxidase
MPLARASFSLALSTTLALAGCSASGTSTSTTTATTSTTTTTTNTIPNLQPYTTPTGSIATYTSAGSIDQTSPFFQSLGTNGRTCATCHQPSQGMSVNVTAIQALFASSSGADPLFAAVDGANCPSGATGNTAAHSLLLNNGLFRIAITLPASAQFKLTVLSDPYGCAVTTNASGQQVVSVYRRPLAATSVNYLSSVMWDTRETVASLATASTFNTNLVADLAQQATDAISTHAQGTTNPTTAQLTAIAAFQQSIFTAQLTDTLAGSLSANGAQGGPTNLAAVTYTPGINDSLPGGAVAFNPASMTLYNAWANSANAQQASIARGQNIFNTAPFNISDAPGLTGTIPHASCSFCHDTPNVGNRSVNLPIDTGTSHNTAAETDPNVTAGLAALNVPSLPVYQITGCTNPATNQPVTYTTSDPGVGLFTGRCADIGRTQVPILRGLAARAPYFHGGAAANLQQVVAFYNARFQMNLSAAQQADLVNFLNAL